MALASIFLIDRITEKDQFPITVCLIPVELLNLAVKAERKQRDCCLRTEDQCTTLEH